MTDVGAAPETDGEDLIRLIGDWSLWPWAVLRGAGFPASWVLRLGAPETARVAEQLAEAEVELHRHAAHLLEALRQPSADLEEQRGKLRRARKRVAQIKLPAVADILGIADAEFAAMQVSHDQVAFKRIVFAEPSRRAIAT